MTPKQQLLEALSQNDKKSVEHYANLMETGKVSLQRDFDCLWDEKIQADQEIENLRICMRDSYECMESANNLALLLLNHPEAKEHKEWRKGFFQALERVSKTMLQGIQEDA